MRKVIGMIATKVDNTIIYYGENRNDCKKVDSTMILTSIMVKIGMIDKSGQYNLLW